MLDELQHQGVWGQVDKVGQGGEEGRTVRALTEIVYKLYM
jgi:hypothetical protein